MSSRLTVGRHDARWWRWGAWFGFAATFGSWLAVRHGPLTWMMACLTIVTALIWQRGRVHNQALVLLAVAAVQAGFTSVASLSSVRTLAMIAAVVATIIAVALPRTPQVLLSLLAIINVVQFVAYVAGFDNALGGLLYGSLLYPYLFSSMGILMAMKARTQLRSTS